MSPYAASKLATEAYTNAYAHSFGMATLALRFFNVFGPRQPAGHAYAAVVPAFIDAALAGRPLPIDGDGRQTRDFTFVDSVAAVIADAVVRRVTDPEPVNLAFGTRTDLLTLIDLLEAAIGHPLERLHRPSRVGDVPRLAGRQRPPARAVPRHRAGPARGRARRDRRVDAGRSREPDAALRRPPTV